MTFLERVQSWLAKRPPEPTGADIDRMLAERQRQAGAAFQEEMARRVAHGQLAYFPGDSDQPRSPSQDGDGWIRWGP